MDAFETKLNALYNKCKIKYSPRSYSLKERVIVKHDVDEVRKSSIQVIDTNAEQELCRCILNGWGEPFDYNAISDFPEILGPITSSGYTKHIDAWYPLKYRAGCTWFNNLYVSAAAMFADTGINIKDLTQISTIEALFQLAYAITSTKSISSELIESVYNVSPEYTFTDLYKSKHITDMLEKHTLEHVIPRVNVYRPVVKKPYGPKFINRIDANSWDSTSVTFPSPETTGLVISGMQADIACALEITYLVSTLDPTVQKILIPKLYDTDSRFTELVTRNLTGFSVDPIITLSDNADTRYKAIYNYIRTSEILDYCKSNEVVLRACANHEGCSRTMGMYISLLKSYSEVIIRTKLCATLYNYAKSNNMLETLATDDFSEIMHDLSKVLGGISTSEDSAETDSKLNSMMDLSPMRKYSSDTTPSGSGGDTRPPVNDLLDGLVTSKEVASYRYTVQRVNRHDDDARKAYMQIAEQVPRVTSELIRSIKEIRVYNSGGKNAGKERGKLDTKALWHYRTNPKIFYDNTYKCKECDPAFGIVLDASGSMSGSNIENGKLTMIVLHETLKALSINHSIITHTSHGRHDVIIEKYQAFREDKDYSLLKNYGIVDIEAHSGNCDSGALYFMERALLRTRNRDKICIIFSDGAPTECTSRELLDQVAHMEACGIKVIGIGIDNPEIADYYKDYANGANLQQMLKIVTDILKEYVIHKKED